MYVDGVPVVLNGGAHGPRSIVLLLFLQKQNLANAIYLFGLGTLLSGLGLKHMRIRSHHDLASTLVTPYSWEDHGGVLLPQLLRDSALGRDDGLRGLLGLLVLRAGGR